MTKFDHFRITGEAFTKLARDFFLEGDPTRALRFITKGLHGVTVEIACAVLDGRQRFTGNETDGIGVEDDTPDPTYLASIQYQYAGRFRFQAQWWRPVAYTSARREEDGRFASRALNGLPSLSDSDRMGRFGLLRVEYYAAPGERALRLDHTVLNPHARSKYGQEYELGFVIVEPCAEAPWWWDTVPTTVTEALEAFFKAGRRLEDRTEDVASPRKSASKPYVPTKEEREVAKILREKEAAEADARDAREEAEFRVRQDRWRTEILAQNGDDWIEIAGVKVAAKPFRWWSTRRTALRRYVAEWESVSPVGLKRMLDDPSHTDWYLSTGRYLPYPYHSDFDEAVYEVSWQLQRDLGDFEAHVIVDGGECYGTVGKEIVVVPDLRPERLEEVAGKKVILTERGGELAHLAVVAREQGNVTIMRVPDACAKFPLGTVLLVFPEEGKVTASKVSTIPTEGTPE